MKGSVTGREWRRREENMEVARSLRDRIGCGTLASRILAARGFRTSDEAYGFIHRSPRSLHDPFHIPGMEKAVALISENLMSGGKILIHGDYDADGITSTALLSKALGSAYGNKRARHFLPSRYGEGYGISRKILKECAENGTDMIITVDCGIRDVEAAEIAADLGLKMIITDHHERGDDLPGPDALVDPKAIPGEYPFRELAGVGVAFKLAHALQMKEMIPVDVRELLDLVAIGTVADLVPLVDENRTLVSLGLDRIRETGSLGIRALLRESGVDVINGPKASDIAYKLGPRINSAGRMGDPDMALDLFLTDNRVDADLFARQLNTLNFKRRNVGQKLAIEVKERIESGNLNDDPFIVVAGKDWNPGVIGITASKVMNELSRPVAVITIDENGVAKGSIRAPDGFDLGPALESSGHLLDQFGGHERAAGITLKDGNIPLLRSSFIDFTRDRYPDLEFTPIMDIDLDVSPDELEEEEVIELEKLEPFGVSNPHPVVSIRDAMIDGSVTTVGDGKHLKFMIAGEGNSIKCIFFNHGDLSRRLGPGSMVSVSGEPSIHRWGGRSDVQINIFDMILEEI